MAEVKHRLLYVDFTPGWIGVADSGGVLLERRYCPTTCTQRGELAAIQLASQVGEERWPADRFVVLSDSAGAVRMIRGGRPHPRAKQPKALVDLAGRIASRLQENEIAWIPRSANQAHAALARATTKKGRER